MKSFKIVFIEVMKHALKVVMAMIIAILLLMVLTGLNQAAQAQETIVPTATINLSSPATLNPTATINLSSPVPYRSKGPQGPILAAGTTVSESARVFKSTSPTKPPKNTKTLTAIYATLITTDSYLTYNALQKGGVQEANPMYSFDSNTSFEEILITNLAVSTGMHFLSKRLMGKNPIKVEIGLRGIVVAWNLQY